VFTCSAGDIFEFKPANRADVLETRTKAEFEARALGIMDLDAIAVGEMDLGFGRDFLKEMASKYGLRFVSANAVDADTREPLFDPFIVRTIDGVRIAFLGVVSPERHIVAQVESTLLDKKIEILDPTEMVNRYLPAAREQSDIVVLLSHTGIESSEFLAEDLGVDVVVVGHYPAVLNQPKDIGGTTLVMAGAKSDRFGTLSLRLADDGTVKTVGGDAIRLLAKGPENPDIAAIAREADEKEKALRRERQLAAQRERETRQQHEQTEKLVSRGGIYGAESCKTCHQTIYESWMQTPHATAFATLAEADAWDNPDCIGCHVTGMEDKSYVADVNVSPEVWNVQCEECHGSGVGHARDGSYVTGGEATCRKCHDPDNSPDFDFAIYKTYGVH
jgi:hypothetical protein